MLRRALGSHRHGTVVGHVFGTPRWCRTVDYRKRAVLPFDLMSGGNGNNQEIESLDEIDRQIAIALQVNGRASWGSVARSLDMPERTVTRRGQALIDNGIVRVSTYLDTTRVGESRPLILVAYTEPGRSLEIAQLIAGRDDASSVSVLEGTDHLVCMLIPSDDQSRRKLLFKDLTLIDGLKDTTVSTVLRYYRAGYDWSAGGLSDEARKTLSNLPTSDPDRSDSVVLDDDDRRIITELAKDGRESITAMAKSLGLSAQTIQRRLNNLFQSGAIHIRTEVSPNLFGLDVEVLVWIQAAPAEVDQLGRNLATHPAVRFCAATTGQSQLLLTCLFRHENELYEFLTDYLGSHGVTRVADVAVVVVALRRGPLIMPIPTF
jgi:DNA-binding Lrp family transcriptional regulator